MVSELWSWDNCKEKITSLSGRLGFPKAPYLKFLKLKLLFEDGTIYDEIRGKNWSNVAPIYCVLTTYSQAKELEETGKLISFSKLPGGAQYKGVFIKRTVEPIAKTFGENPELLYEAAKVFDAEKMSFGDCSVKIYSLPRVPIIYVLWGKSAEFPASANVLFDSTIANYLTTEEVQLLSELTTIRLRHALEYIVREK
ncbi:MAG TPA: DUF3786 domain-containing protein [Candidatus Bathyarchaeota archaeon]|nr:DUF3786 domain-containing protein [Candidatus Bathyarchaeota archaeon]